MGVLSYEVKYQREWLGLSLLEFAQELNKSVALVRQFEDGERQVTEQYIMDIRAKFGYVPLSDHFKKSFKKPIEWREPLVTAIPRNKEKFVGLFDGKND